MLPLDPRAQSFCRSPGGGLVGIDEDDGKLFAAEGATRSVFRELETNTRPSIVRTSSPAG